MDAEVHNHELLGSKFWIIDDLLEDPDRLARYLFSRQTASLSHTKVVWQKQHKII